jgi:peptide/nickel transport system permease protein
VVVILLCLMAFFAPLIAPFSPEEQDFASYLQPPSRKFLFGTDEQGRDVFSRVVFGSRLSLRIGIISVSIACVAGVILGTIAGYSGGIADLAIMRFADIMLAFPQILLALALLAIMGPGLTTVMIAVGISAIPSYMRVVRSSVLSAKETEYVLAARATGCRTARLMFRHVLPNCIAPALVLATTGMAAAIITGAALSFLGLGVQPPTPEWGSMLSNGRRFLRHAPWMMFFPGLFITIAVMSINLFGDGLRDALDPRLKE